MLVIPLLVLPILRRPGTVLALACLGAGAGRVGGEATRLAERGSCRARLPAGEVTVRVRADGELLVNLSLDSLTESVNGTSCSSSMRNLCASRSNTL